MQFLKKAFYVFGYVFLITPSKAAEVVARHRLNGGEMSAQPLSVVLIIETLGRSVVILGSSVLCQQIIGGYWYSVIELDKCAFVLLLSGLVHQFSYFFFISRQGVEPTPRNFMLYRLVRNTCYSFLPGLLVVVTVCYVNAVAVVEVYNEEQVLLAYLLSTFVFFLIGLGEALLSRRVPTSLDLATKFRFGCG